VSNALARPVTMGRAAYMAGRSPAGVGRTSHLYDSWVKLPDHPPLPEMPSAPRLQAMVQQVLASTGWSTRDVAALVGVSHTTIQHWNAGRLPRSLRRSNVAAFEVLDGIHRVLQRLQTLAGSDQARLGSLLRAVPAGGAGSPYVLLQHRDFAGAYLAALDLLRPSRPEGLLVGSRPARSGRAVSSLDHGR